MRKKEYYILFLLLQVGMLGVFMSLDFFLFYLFWEVMLVPMYFLIGVWGSDRRLYAAIKFFLYTLAGSVLMLLAILALYYHAHEVTGTAYTFDIPTLLADRAAILHQLPADPLLGLLLRLRHQSADVSVPHLAARRAHRSSHGRLRDPGGRSVEDGHVRLHPLLAAAAADRCRGAAAHRHDPDGRLDHRHHLRRAGLHDAEGHEEAHRLQLGEPPGLLHAGNFRAEPARPFRQRHPADQSRNFHRRALLADRRSLRTPAHAPDFGVRRALHAHAQLRGHLHDRHAQLAGPAAAQRLHRRVHHPERRLSGEPALGGLGRDRHRAGRGVPACGSTSG